MPVNKMEFEIIACFGRKRQRSKSKRRRTRIVKILASITNNRLKKILAAYFKFPLRHMFDTQNFA